MRSNALKLLKTPIVNDCMITYHPQVVCVQPSTKQKITSEVLDLVRSKVDHEYYSVRLEDNVIYIKYKDYTVQPVK